MECCKNICDDEIALILNSREYDLIVEALTDYIYGKLELLVENGDIEHLILVIKAID